MKVIVQALVIQRVKDVVVHVRAHAHQRVKDVVKIPVRGDVKAQTDSL